MQSAYNKDGCENFSFEVIEVIEYIEDIAKFKYIILRQEQYWIDFYEATNNSKGYNNRPNAESNLGIKLGAPSEEHRQKIGESNKGFRHTEETKNIIKEKRKLQVFSEETRKKMSLAQKRIGKIPPSCKGRIHSTESRNKIGKASTGRFPNEKSRKKMSEAHNKKVKNSTTGKIFKSMKEAALYYGIQSSGISSVCRGLKEKAGGFQWEYYNIIEG